ncbi:hypothetical protein HN51_042914 [Arachis hypogaea]|uniref:Uncharacterized protein n=1 Tax=Arachis hypogaea TaxID=3818 RepID=A0A444Y7W3_ARAHY|nr:uncharacterized protein LOC107610330 [Arachis ipaensis]RYQ98040.1 hypothetical protein Ahy_B08g094119 [Arachis hypogaea]
MQSMLNHGVPVCLSGIIHPSLFLMRWEDHERRRKAMKRMQTSLVLREEHVHANQDFVNVKGGDDEAKFFLY